MTNKYMQNIDGEKIDFRDILDADKIFQERLKRIEELKRSERHEKKVVKFFSAFLGKKPRKEKTEHVAENKE